MSVNGILIRKGATVFTIEPTDSLANAAKSLTNHGIGALMVTDAEGHTVGIISERDITRRKGKRRLRNARRRDHDPQSRILQPTGQVGRLDATHGRRQVPSFACNRGRTTNRHRVDW